MSKIYIAGIAMTVFGRHIERGIADLAREALRGALQDAGCAVSDIDTAFYAGITNGALQGQLSIPGQAVFGKIGIRGTPVFNIENASASGLAAPGEGGPAAERGEFALGGASPSTPRAGWRRRAIRWVRPASGSWWNSLPSCAAKRERARSHGPATRSSKTAAAWWVSRKERLPSIFSAGKHEEQTSFGRLMMLTGNTFGPFPRVSAAR